VHASTPIRLIAITRSQTPGSVSAKKPNSSVPALLTRIENGPWSFATAAAEAGSVTSRCAASAEAAVDSAGGTLDILINNAGTDEFGFFVDMTPDRWEKVIAVNLTGVFNCTHAALPGMQAAKYGRIVNIASEAGRVGSKGSAVYSAAKGGVLGFTKALAIENGRYGITVNAVAPGPIETPLLMAAPEALGDIGKRIVDTMIGSTNLRRLGHPDEVAAAIAFLASDDASYVTGQSLGVSGGLARI